ncbi:MAG: bifunctional folylpolyglutamate synthase/dihydrofolate synthase [Firmicutes bacterium]|nr:bifunctional folylpolyglutamate synthase/dihydrofolate synthase [Bacillota bacterium]
MMTYEEALEKIHSFEVFGSKLGLERMQKLLDLLGNPEKGLKIIHVAGTNGKGSVCRYVYSVLREAGCRTGIYVSPYVERFTERIECDGREISPEELAVNTEKVLAAVDQMLAEGLESPTEFEVVTAIGFLHFAKEKADFVVLEVGMGGRGDATNICAPMATAITSIDYDHMAVLGNTLPKIAVEKAGIIKPGVPVVVMVKDGQAKQAIREIATRRKAPFIDASRAVVSGIEEDLTGYSFDVDFSAFRGRRAPGETAEEQANQCRKPEAVGIPDLSRPERVGKLKLGMPGRHQVDNAVVALLLLRLVADAGFPIPEEALRSGMASAKQPVRFEVFEGEPPFILDGAHNPAGIRSLVTSAEELLKDRRILLCAGILGDKEYESMAAQLSSLGADVIITRVPVPRGMSAEKLAEAFRRAGCRVMNDYEDYREAFRESVRLASGYDVVIWAGSIYLVGAVRTLLKEYRDDRTSEQKKTGEGTAVL